MNCKPTRRADLERTSLTMFALILSASLAFAGSNKLSKDLQEQSGEEIVRRPQPASEKLRAFLAALEAANDNRFLSNRKLHDLLETAFSENWAIARDHVEKITRQLCEIISEGSRDGEFAVDDCDLTAILVRSACMRFWHPRLMVECAEEPEPTLDEIVDFCLAALARSQPAKKLDARNGVHTLTPKRNVAAEDSA